MRVVDPNTGGSFFSKRRGRYDGDLAPRELTFSCYKGYPFLNRDRTVSGSSKPYAKLDKSCRLIFGHGSSCPSMCICLWRRATPPYQLAISKARSKRRWRVGPFSGWNRTPPIGFLASPFAKAPGKGGASDKPAAGMIGTSIILKHFCT